MGYWTTKTRVTVLHGAGDGWQVRADRDAVEWCDEGNGPLGDGIDAAARAFIRVHHRLPRWDEMVVAVIEALECWGESPAVDLLDGDQRAMYDEAVRVGACHEDAMDAALSAR